MLKANQTLFFVFFKETALALPNVLSEVAGNGVNLLQFVPFRVQCTAVGEVVLIDGGASA